MSKKYFLFLLIFLSVACSKEHSSQEGHYKPRVSIQFRLVDESSNNKTDSMKVKTTGETLRLEEKVLLNEKDIASIKMTGGAVKKRELWVTYPNKTKLKFVFKDQEVEEWKKNGVIPADAVIERENSIIENEYQLSMTLTPGGAKKLS